MNLFFERNSNYLSRRRGTVGQLIIKLILCNFYRSFFVVVNAEAEQ